MRINVSADTGTYRDLLTGLKPFRTRSRTAALRGLWADSQKPFYGTHDLGRLPHEYRTSADAADYVVYSYGTPIAWHLPPAAADIMIGTTATGWVVPFVKYSITTTSHQNAIRYALNEVTYSDGKGNVCPGSKARHD